MVFFQGKRKLQLKYSEEKKICIWILLKNFLENSKDKEHDSIIYQKRDWLRKLRWIKKIYTPESTLINLLICFQVLYFL